MKLKLKSSLTILEKNDRKTRFFSVFYRQTLPLKVQFYLVHMYITEECMINKIHWSEIVCIFHWISCLRTLFLIQQLLLLTCIITSLTLHRIKVTLCKTLYMYIYELRNDFSMHISFMIEIGWFLLLFYPFWKIYEIFKNCLNSRILKTNLIYCLTTVLEIWINFPNFISCKSM